MHMHAVYSVTLSLKTYCVIIIRIFQNSLLEYTGWQSVAVVGNKAIDLVAIVIRAP